MLEFKKKTLNTTHLQKLLDKMCIYEMDPNIKRQTDGGTNRQMDGQTDKVKPAYPPSTSLSVGYKNTNLHMLS